MRNNELARLYRFVDMPLFVDDRRAVLVYDPVRNLCFIDRELFSILTPRQKDKLYNAQDSVLVE